MQQDKLFYNGYFWQGENKWAGAVLVGENGAIQEVFQNAEEAECKMGGGVEKVDMQGQWVLPVFEDAHNHPTRFARLFFEIDFRGQNISWEEARELIRKQVARTPIGNWVVCHGWNEERWQSLRSEDLDDLSQEHGILLIDVSEHGGLLNKQGRFLLEQKGLRVPGEFVEDELFEEVCRHTALSKDAYKKGIQKFHEKLLALGVGAVHDMDVSMPEELQAYEELLQEKKLVLPSALYLNPRLLGHTEQISRLLNYNDTFKVCGVKIFLDGAIGTRTAALSRPYEDAATSGMLRMKEKEVAAIAKKAAVLGLRHIAMHCIGDRAIDAAVAIQTKVQKNYPDMLWRYEHFEMPSKGAIATIAENNGVVSVQPNFSWDVENYQGRLGKRTEMINPLQWIEESGATMVFGSDDMPSGPLEGISWAIQKAPFSHQKVSAASAVRAYTETPARIVGAIRGKVGSGHEANFVVFRKNPLEAKNELENLAVEGVWLKGLIQDNQEEYYD